MKIVKSMLAALFVFTGLGTNIGFAHSSYPWESSISAVVCIKNSTDRDIYVAPGWKYTSTSDSITAYPDQDNATLQQGEQRWYARKIISNGGLPKTFVLVLWAVNKNGEKISQEIFEQHIRVDTYRRDIDVSKTNDMKYMCKNSANKEVIYFSNARKFGLI